MARIAKVVNGDVVVCNEYGGRIFSFHPSAGGNAVFVDYNPSIDEFVITTERGDVWRYNSSGGQIGPVSNFSGKKIVMARWQGDDIFVQYSDSSCDLYGKFGGCIRHL